MSQSKLEGLFEPETAVQTVQRWSEDEAAGRESIAKAAGRVRDMAEEIVEAAERVRAATEDDVYDEMLELIELVRKMHVPKRLLLEEARQGGDFGE